MPERCATCHKPARLLFKSWEPGTTYMINGDRAPYLWVEVCSRPCAVQAVYGARRRVPRGHVLEKGPRIGRR